MNRTTFRTHGTRIAAIALIAITATALGACSADSPDPAASADDQPLTVAFATFNDAASTFRPVTTAIKDYGAALGWSVSTFDNAQDPAATLDNARVMAAQSPDVIMEWNAVAGIADTLSATFSDADIPCIAVNIALPGCPLFNVSNALYGQEAGANLAASAAELGWDSGNTTFIALNAPAAGEDPQQLASHAYSVFSQTFPGSEAVDPEEVTLTTTSIGDQFLQVDGKGTLADSTIALKAALQNIPADRNIVVATLNDDSALGALAAIEDAGMRDRALIASQGSSAPGLDKLRTDPIWVSEGAVYVEQWSAYLLAMARALTDGVELPELTIAPQNTLTKETVDDFFEGTKAISSPPIPAESSYLVETGILQALGIDE